MSREVSRNQRFAQFFSRLLPCFISMPVSRMSDLLERFTARSFAFNVLLAVFFSIAALSSFVALLPRLFCEMVKLRALVRSLVDGSRTLRTAKLARGLLRIWPKSDVDCDSERGGRSRAVRSKRSMFDSPSGFALEGSTACRGCMFTTRTLDNSPHTHILPHTTPTDDKIHTHSPSHLLILFRQRVVQHVEMRVVAEAHVHAARRLPQHRTRRRQTGRFADAFTHILSPFPS